MAKRKHTEQVKGSGRWRVGVAQEGVTWLFGGRALPAQLI